MTPQIPITDTEENVYNTDIEPQELIKASRFMLLCLCTGGAYQVWWMYKSYRFFAQKEGHFSNAAIKTTFNFIFLIPLLYKILDFARQQGYQHIYYAVPLYFLIIITSIASLLPLPFIALLPIISSLFFIPPLKALNYAVEHSVDIRSHYNKSLNIRQIVLVCIGGILILFTIFGMALLLISAVLQPES